VKLTEHFTLGELIDSQVAKRRGIDNTPSPEIVGSLRFLAKNLEIVRALLGCPMRISSGYRSTALNVAVGGSLNSRHRLGLAADFKAPAFGSPFETAKAIEASEIEYDELIHEFGDWVHIAFAPVAPRRKTLTIFSADEGYLPGILQRR
jgi:zinc D-Ala-D-Ala carboxypeptidase